MIIESEIKVHPDQIQNESVILKKLSKSSGLGPKQIRHIELIRRSIDARKTPMFIMRYKIYAEEDPPPCNLVSAGFSDQSEKNIVHIIGAGPAGYFAALKCIQIGVKPIIYERGKKVQERRKDLRAIQQFSEVNPDSNYCFGEGGAGTYSDGKLYTRSNKRGNVREILQILVEHGAPSSILVDAHPHIGSNKLPGIVTRIRETIERFGGEVHFGSRMTDMTIENGCIKSILINDDTEIPVGTLILATGHSARDIYSLLQNRKVHIEAKPFALGVRIEHPQPLIDQIQYGTAERPDNLPASSYRLACQIKDAGVFSFCMCPGGLIVPAATSPGEIVVNGMSLSKRDSPYANAGTVVSVDPDKLNQYAQKGALRGMAFQSEVEKKMFDAGDGSQQAPAQRLTDFVQGKLSSNLPSSSYIPGLNSTRLDRLLPRFIYHNLKKGIGVFGRRMKGYYSEEAVVVGTESRTSSPVKIPRKDHSKMHEQIEGLFPCGEGAGYAGGILSAAMDGQNVAIAVKDYITSIT